MTACTTRCTHDHDLSEELEVVRLRARVSELEGGIRTIIAYEWGKPSDGWEVAPSPPAVPSEQKAWRALSALVAAAPHQGTAKEEVERG